MMSDDGLSSIPSVIKPFTTQQPNPNPNPTPTPTTTTTSNTIPAPKKKRSLPGTPDPDAEVIALSPKSLMATNRFLCEICNKGFQRDQNLQLHRRGHNLPWKLKQRSSKEAIRKKVYICPEKSCVHHNRTRALGDLTGIKKHYSRKHGEKKWKCEKCSKKYAVQSDWKAHCKICGTREYKCDCGTLFSRKDSFITHRAFCDALAEEGSRFTGSAPTPNLNFKSGMASGTIGLSNMSSDVVEKPRQLPLWLDHATSPLNPTRIPTTTTASAAGLPEILLHTPQPHMLGSSTQWLDNGTNMLSPLSMPMGPKVERENKGNSSDTISCSYYNTQSSQQEAPAHMSATALLQKAAQMGSTRSNVSTAGLFGNGFGLMNSSLSSVSNFDSFNQNRNEVLLRRFPGQSNPGELLNELVMSSMSTSAVPAANWFGDINCSSSLAADNIGVLESQRMMLSSSSGKQIEPSCNELGREMTRDFLGVGGDRPLLQEELAKFASVGTTAMGLRHFSRGH